MRAVPKSLQILRWFLVVVVAAALLAGCAARAPMREAIDSELAVETFDAAWTIIHETHFDPEFNGVDWMALRDELRPQATAAEYTDDVRSVIREMISRLDQSHFALIPRSAVDDDPRFDVDDDSEGDGQLGLELRLIDEGLVITSVEPDGPADRAGVRPGWLLATVEGSDTAEWIERFSEIDDGNGGRFIAVEAVLSRLSGAAGSFASLEFLDGEGKTVAVEVERVPPYGDPIQFGNLPAFFARLHHREAAPEDLGIKVGVIHMNVWMTNMMQPFAEAVDLYRGHDGIVVDLRGNPGGVGGMAMGIAGHFIDERVPLGKMRMRSQDLNFVSMPQRVSPAGKRVTPFEGTVAILIDEMSASTTEVFAGGVQGAGRARIFGRRSAGMALPAVMERLPNQDVLYHAIADFSTPGGMQIEKNGITPDTVVALTRDDLLAGSDAPLEEALRWIADQTR